MRVKMKRLAGFAVTAVILCLTTTTSDAQVRPYRVTDRQVQTVINRVENSTDRFKTQLGRALDRSSLDGTDREDSLNSMVSNFESATNRLKDNFNARRSTSADLQDVLNRGARIDQFMRNNRMTRQAENTWTQIRNDLNVLAGYYRVTANWNYTGPLPGQYPGTPPYRVSDSQVQAIVDRVENSTDRFKSQLGRALDRSNIDGTDREDSLNARVANFEAATNRLKESVNGRRSTAMELQDVLNRGAMIDQFMRNNRLSNPAENTWTQIRNDLNTLAGYYNVTANWNYTGPFPGQNPVVPGTGYYATDAQMRTIVTRLRNNGSQFRNRWDQWARRGFNNQAAGITPFIEEFDRAIDDLRVNYVNRSWAGSNLEQVLRPSAAINDYFARNRPSADLANRWNQIRTDLDTLAGYYRVSWDWNNPTYRSPTYGGGFGGGVDAQLTGTFRLNTTLSDNVSTVVNRSIVNARYNRNRDRLRQNLERRLRSPEMLSLEKRGSQVSMAIGNGQRIDFAADGTAQTETSPNGRSVTTRVIATGRDLTINYEGDRMNDYYVSFTPVGNQLRVTRRVHIEDQNETVTVNSVYDRISPTPQWGTTPGPGWVGGNTGGWIIPNNTAIVASLNTPLSTRTARDGDRFQMTVDAPSQYSGAIIEGRVIGERSGVVSGRANMSLSFDTIRMRDGRTYQFAGIVNQVRETDGDLISVNNEGQIRDSSQTTRTVTRAGIGALLGAVIGAIAGGGEGAAIGAGVGAGAGAGTVILQGRDNLELETGTQFSITATAPMNVGLR